MPLRDGVVLVGGLDEAQGTARELRAEGFTVVALESDDPRAEPLAEADGWRFVARPVERGFELLDRRREARVDCPSLVSLVEGLSSAG